MANALVAVRAVAIVIVKAVSAAKKIKINRIRKILTYLGGKVMNKNNLIIILYALLSTGAFKDKLAKAILYGIENKNFN